MAFRLGAALTLLSFIAFRRYLRRGGPRGLAIAASAFALAIVGHPMSLSCWALRGCDSRFCGPGEESVSGT